MSVLAGCGGGGGGEQAAQTEISTHAIAFAAASVEAPTPAPQVFTVTFGSDIAHLAVIHSGDAVAGVTSTLNGRTAQVTVQPASPATLGAGPFVGAVAVTGYTCADATCTKLSAGSTSTVAVKYQVSAFVQRVAPYVAVAGASDTVVIRGLGLQAFGVQGVSFGNVAATSFTVDGATQIRATHPALAAGTYPVHLSAPNHEGEIPSHATLVVVDPIAYTATALNHPTAPTVVNNLIYDAERRALLMVDNAGGGSVVRYSYASGAWSAPVGATADIRDVALSVDGTQLYGITAGAVTPIDPVTLALGTPIAAPSLVSGAFLKNIVVGNDDVALITTGISGSTLTSGYVYSPRAATVVANNVSLSNATPRMAANGTLAFASQGDPSITTELSVSRYTTSTGQLTSAGVSLRQNEIPPAVDRAANRLVLNGSRVYSVADTLNPFGTLPATTQAVVLKPDGTRAYTYDSASNSIVVYDTTVDRDEAALTPLGSVTAFAAPGGSVKMAITPDGGTLFMAGTSQIVVQPTPAL